MKKALFTLLIIMLAASVNAQDGQSEAKHWTHKGNTGLNLSQSSYTNWAAGGQNALCWLGTYNYAINYSKDKWKWDNTLSTALGYSYFNFHLKPIKTDDKIEFTSLAGLKATDKLNYSLEFAFRSQFANGYDYAKDSTSPISLFLAPAYITLGAGVQWVPNKHFSINFAPLAGRVTIVNDDTLSARGAFGVTPGEKVRYEFGARATAKMNYTVVENVNFESKLELFSNYLDHPERVDVDWQNMLIMKVNSWLNCNVSTRMIYDYDIPFYDIDPNTGASVLDPNSKVQFKEVLSIGILFNLK